MFLISNCLVSFSHKCKETQVQLSLKLAFLDRLSKRGLEYNSRPLLLSLSKKSSENWAFSFRCGKIKKKGRKSEGNAGNRTDEQR